VFPDTKRTLHCSVLRVIHQNSRLISSITTKLNDFLYLTGDRNAYINKKSLKSVAICAIKSSAEQALISFIPPTLVYGYRTG
jgi:hypothetical protein